VTARRCAARPFPPRRERAGHSSTQAAEAIAKTSRIRPRAGAHGTKSVEPYSVISATQLYQGTRRRCPTASHSRVPSRMEAL
jgi:hypothetical protein